jgi:hypothetical protein
MGTGRQGWLVSELRWMISATHCVFGGGTSREDIPLIVSAIVHLGEHNSEWRHSNSPSMVLLPLPSLSCGRHYLNLDGV